MAYCTIRLNICSNHMYLNYTGINFLLISPKSHWEEYICPECDEVMNDPILTSCDHHMCHKCFENLQNCTQ